MSCRSGAGALALALFLTACSKSEPPVANAPGSSPVDPATAATVSGQILLSGTPPAAAVIRLSGDPACVTLNGSDSRTTDVIAVGDGNALANTFVYVRDGVPQRFYPIPSDPVVLDQQKCWYVPRVLGMQVGQPLKIRNSDPLLHNVRSEGAINEAFDIGQPVQGVETTKTFTTREVMVPFKCNVHAWMRAYVGVLEHPFFAVTDANGRFTLPQLPPGTYTLETWHEQLGRQEQQITVAAKEAKAVTFTYKVS